MAYKWEKLYNGMVYVMTCEGCKPRPKIAAFDMDWTLIGTKSGNVFPKGPTDWRFLYETRTVDKIRSLHHDQDFKIVVISNQSRLTNDDAVAKFKSKVESIAKGLKDVPIQVFVSAATGSSVFRKPRTGIFEVLRRDLNGEYSEIDVQSSFYCGDAAGRLKKASDGKKDFACSDRLFAMNIGLKFLTPEQFFLGKKSEEEHDMPEFDPKSIFTTPKPLLEPPTATLTSLKPEVIMMCGMQGSGKSTVATKWLGKGAGYAVLSNDALGGRDKTITAMKSILSQKPICQSVVIDNTHVDKEARQKFIRVAQEFDVPCRCFVMNASFAQVKHHNIFRDIVDKNHTKIKEPLLHSFKSKYQHPTLDEGFEEIVHVNFVPSFETEEHQAIYSMYLVEK